MNTILRRIIVGALAVTIPVGGSIFYFANKSEEKEANKKGEIVDKVDDKTNDKDKKNDNVKHPGTDAKVSNPHKENIENKKKEYDNSEIVGILTIPDTSIDTVIVQHNDNDYYLDHNAKKEEDPAGATFLDYRVEVNSGRKNIIYGHNGDSDLLNVPFAELEKYYEEDFYKNHKYITLEDKDGVGTYEIFSVFVETREPNYMYLNFKNDSSWNEHINYLKNKSLYATYVNVDSTDDILILQTCSHREEYSKYKDRYLLVVAKRINYE